METSAMDEVSFKQAREAEGYSVFKVVRWDPDTVNAVHTHDFGAHILVLDGEITVVTEDGQSTICRAGDTFALNSGIPHAETVGPNGVKILSARK